ncbi:MAG: repeat containing protein [Akkermansiaceae bacterium]|nr:repeat containing protein [Akkermansiaceae bacterium]
MLLLGSSALAAPEPFQIGEIPGAEFGTPVRSDQIDLAAFAEWVDGVERRIEPGQDGDKSRLPQWLLSTTTTTTGHSGIAFGDSKRPGPRHLRIGFQQAIPVGSVFSQDGGSLSILKPGAEYPGDLNDDSQWLPAQRLKQGRLTGAETTEEEDLALWVLPPGTTTRALRFSHIAAPSDENYAGKLSGALVLPQRFLNEAAIATAAASARSELADRLINGNHDGWEAWDNQEKSPPPESSPVISPEHPEWVMLTWLRPVKLDGLVAFWAGIGAAEVETFSGPPGRNPRDADEADWKPVASYAGIQHQYATRFWPNRLAFAKPLETRALRLKITAPGEALSHATNNDGRRIWLGELMALHSLGETPFKDAVQLAAQPSKENHPPIPVKFHLATAGYVTLVVERPDGFRVRNLVADTWFPAGDNTAWWDGTDDLGRDADAARHGVYRIPGRLVAPGAYRVRGLTRGEITPRYEFAVYAPGNPPWSTDDSTGGWLANHTPPQAAVFLPAAQSPTGSPVVELGCYVTEGPAGFAWVDLDGHKLGGKKWIGGNWTAAPYLGRDTGPQPQPGVQVYVASAWETDGKSGEGELRVTALTKEGDKPVLKYPLGLMIPNARGEKAEGQLGGIAVFNTTAAISLTRRNELLIVDAAGGQVTRTLSLPAPQGLAWDRSGALLVLSGTQLLRYPALDQPPVPLISSGLEEPVGLTLDESGTLYISDHGNSHQVKIFTPDGKFVRAIGKPGAPHAGPYDPEHMNRPLGMAVDSRRQLWVAEHDFVPKRVSVWSLDTGELIRGIAGPGKYGGGGALDPQDKNLFYYADENRGTLQFHLNWKDGTSRLERVLYRGDDAHSLPLPKDCAAPEAAIYHDGRKYFTDAWNSNPTGGSRSAFLFAERDGVARAVAGMGDATAWPVLADPAFAACWPQGLSATGKGQEAFFIWSDRNDDLQVQPDEVTIEKVQGGGITVMPDLSFAVARLGGRAVSFAPASFTAAGTPVYDATKGTVVAPEVQNPQSSGGDQLLTGSGGWSVVTLGVAPFGPLSISGVKDGGAKWSYPNLWPGLHASHNAPRPDRPGQLIGATRLPGGFFEVAGSDAGPLWALHTNHGRLVFFTQDGLFVASVFEDMRGGKGWKMPAAPRGMDLSDVTLGEENFWPTLTHSSDGQVYLVDGARSAIVRLDGMESIRRLPDSDLTVTAAELDRSRNWQIAAEAARQRLAGSGLMTVALLPKKPEVDGRMEDWPEDGWVDVDKSGVKAYFNSDSKPYDVTAALAVSGDRLYAGWRTGSKDGLRNSGEMPLAPFKTGDALDLMLGPAGNRSAPVAGDLRLIVTTVKGQPKALLYRAVVPGTREPDKVPFSSPWRTITFDKVEDVTAQIEFATGGEGNYEISIPLATLGLRPAPGARIRGDIGLLRGDGAETRSRAYWSNKSTGIVSDVPDEAMLTPELWGTLEFK